MEPRYTEVKVVRLTPSMLEALKKLSQRHEVSISVLLRRAIKQWLARQKDC